MRVNTRLLYHLAFWIGYVLFKAFINVGASSNPMPSNFSAKAMALLTLAQLALLIVKVPMVYTLFFITEEFLLKKWSRARTAVSIVVLLALGVAAMFPVTKFIVLDRIYKVSYNLTGYINPYSVLYNAFVLIFCCSLALAIKLTRLYLRQKKTEQEIVRKKLETELQFLKSQTNPHFLFNTLNNIYALARKKSDHTADVVLKLSQLLRFMLYESQLNTIPVRDEIRVLDDYIELEKIRYGEKLSLRFSRSVDDDSQPIAPLMLLPFVENAFKHGASESRFGSYINIDLRLESEQLYFVIENSKSDDPVTQKPENIGLNNIRRQLELLYPGHRLEIESAPHRFAVSLTLNLGNHATI